MDKGFDEFTARPSPQCATVRFVIDGSSYS